MPKKRFTDEQIAFALRQAEVLTIPSIVTFLIASRRPGMNPASASAELFKGFPENYQMMPEVGGASHAPQETGTGAAFLCIKWSNPHARGLLRSNPAAIGQPQ